jgi:predicted short-subunit dehydrogenase-like oxidoreductase (DUF2520 family)
MISIVILGTGNVAKHLFDAFLVQSDIEIVQVYGRNKNSLSHFKNEVNSTSEISKLKPADVYILAISDDAIAKVSKRFMETKGILVHTSGSVPLKSLSGKNRRGVFYPLQTFSADRSVDFKSVPICIEAENATDYDLLKKLASTLSETVIQIDSNKRKALHLSAVFVNNFTNHMYYSAQEICVQNAVPFNLLLPLITETAAKIEDLTPFEAQTGPAMRNDKGSLKKHLALLKAKKHKKIYSLLSKSIRKTYEKKL